MRPLLKKRVTKKVGGEDIVVGFSTAGNRHIYSDTFGRAKGLKKDDLKNIDKALAKAAYVKSAPLSKPRKDGISKFYYFKDCGCSLPDQSLFDGTKGLIGYGKRLYYNVAEVRRGKHVSRFLYSVTDKLK